MIGNDWDILLKNIFEGEGFNNFIKSIKDKYKTNICYPEYDDIFNALKLTSFKDTKVVIMGQDTLRIDRI